MQESKKPVYILGISCFYHDGSACLLRDGEVVAAAQEERFDRIKYSPAFPIQAVNYCLQEEGITSFDLEHVAFYEKMYLKFERTILSHLKGFPFTIKNFIETMPLWLSDRLTVPLIIRDELSFKGKIWHVKHHLSHAASAFYSSGFDSAAIMTVDGVGEYDTTTLGRAAHNRIDVLKEISYPHSLGLLYSIVTSYLGFRVFTGEGKVMALAEFGEAKYLDEFKKLIDIKEDGSFSLDLKFFSFNRGERMYNKKFIKLLGEPRKEKSEITKRHKDIAASLQRITEEVLLKMGAYLHKLTGEKNLCLAGGVFLNVTANTRILKELPFENIYIQPAAGDAGSSLGAAMYIHHEALKNESSKNRLESMSLGPCYKERSIETLLINHGLKYDKLDNSSLLKETARVISEGKIVGWFQGRMEFGPRALGNRSILADPRDPGMKDKLNKKVKHREWFRPFGASVLAERVADYFDFEKESPFMLFVAPILKEKLSEIPAITHINETSRIQTVDSKNQPYYNLIKEFEKLTGVPMLLNTSFNDDEPIVCSPEDAIHCFLKTDLDFMVIENFFVRK